jgi:hypothetical protein
MTETFDLRDIMLEATAEIQEIVREVLEELAEPQMLAEIQKQWTSLPDDQKEQFMRENPDEYRALMDAIERR